MHLIDKTDSVQFVVTDEGPKARVSGRPTDVALRLLREKSLAINQQFPNIVGAVPGLLVGQLFECRAEMVAVGGHKMAMSGISHQTKGAAKEQVGETHR